MAAALPVVGGMVSAYGAMKQGVDQYSSLNQQADLAIQNAAEAEAKGKYDASRQQVIAGQKQGTAIAAFGASGVRTDSGSVTAVLGASAQNAELDRLNILHGADVRATNYTNQANLDRFGAESALKGSYFQAAGNVLGSAGKVFGNSQSANNPVNSDSDTMAGGGESAANYA